MAEENEKEQKPNFEKCKKINSIPLEEQVKKLTEEIKEIKFSKKYNKFMQIETEDEEFINEKEIEANNNGTITINNRVDDPKQLKNVIDHEEVHVDQFKRFECNP